MKKTATVCSLEMLLLRINCMHEVSCQYTETGRLGKVITRLKEKGIAVKREKASNVDMLDEKIKPPVE